MPKSRGGDGDSGVSARMEGSFLTAMNDIQELVFWVFTANDVRQMHEAFFRAERVDGVFYVRLPGAEQRAALWRLYTRKFFPKDVTLGGKTVPFPRYVNPDAAALTKELKAEKKPSVKAWAAKFALPLLGLAGEAREAALAAVAAVNADVAEAAAAALFDDTGWSPAEIRACCRLARRLKEPVTEVRKSIRPVSVSAAKVIERLEEWAAGAALDAETGEVYSPETAELIPTAPVVKEGSTVRRKVRRVKPG